MKRLYWGGPILTLEKECYADAVLTENGVIRAVGDKAALAAGAPDAKSVSLDGATLLPAFLDSHGHFSQVANSFLQVSLAGADSEAEMARRVSAFQAQQRIPPGAWLLARDYDHNLLPGGQNPTLAALDKMAPENPLLIQHQSGHMGLLNTPALAALGVTPDTPDPEGGRIGRDKERLTGYLEENAFFSYQRAVPMPGQRQLIQGYRQAQETYFSHGITTLQEGLYVAQMEPMFQMLLGTGLLKADLVAYPDPPSWKRATEIFPGHTGRYQDGLKLGGVKIFLDGSPQGRTAWMRAPYAGTSDRGYGTMQDGDVTDAMLFAGENGLQLLAHCNGDAAAAQFLRCLRAAEGRCPALRQLRPVIIHAQLLGLDQIQEAAALGAVASFFVGHIWHWGGVHLRNFGRDRAEQISPAASALGAGLPFTFHQDAPVTPPDMLESISCAAARRTKEGTILGENQKIPVLDAIRAVTQTAAYQYFEEHEKGSIRPGKQANFVILDRDPLKTPPEEIRHLQVLQTIQRDEIVFSG